MCVLVFCFLAAIILQPSRLSHHFIRGSSMLTTAATASLALTSSRCCSHALPTSRAFHAAARRGLGRSPTSVYTHKRQASSSSGVSSKIQGVFPSVSSCQLMTDYLWSPVLPFQLMPNHALQYASAFTTAVVMRDRVGNGLLKGFYHVG